MRYLYFSCFAKKSTKRRRIKGHSEKACPLKKPLRRIASQRPKMFRFLNAYNPWFCRFSLCRLPKIGTFSAVGWRCGWGFQRGRIFVAPLWPHSLVTFLAEQESNITALRALQKGIHSCKSQLQTGTFDDRIIMTKYVYKRKKRNGSNV